jgi:hypothetical protein
MHRPLLAAAVLAAALLAPSSSLASDTPWSALSAKALSSTQQPAIAALSDGTAQVLYHQPNPGGTLDDMFSRRVLSNGSVGAPVPVATFDGFDDPDLVQTPGGLLAILPGLKDPGYKNVAAATAPLDGSAWTLSAGDVAPLPGPFYANSAGLALDATGTPFFTGAGLIHRGLDPNTQNYDHQATIGGGCCAYDSDLATDGATGALYAAWYSNAKQQGVWIDQVDTASGAPVGQPVLMPGTVVNYKGTPNSIAASYRTPITGRTGQPGVFLAYPGGYPASRKVLLFRVGNPQSSTLFNSPTSRIGAMAVATDSAGRLWVVWGRRDHGTDMIMARRSDPTVHEFGTARTFALPKQADHTWSISAAAGANGRLSIAANLELKPGGNKSNQVWFAALEPALSYTTAPAKLKHGKAAKLKVHVSDAGVALAGASVLVRQGAKKVKGTTNGAGDVSLSVPKFKKGVAQLTISAAGYATTRDSLTVK